jgi:glutamate--cysteine ligase
MTANTVDLLRPFATDASRAERIGIEAECALVRPGTGESVEYEGPRGIEAMLREVLACTHGEPVTEDGHILAIARPDGSQLSLEPGGAIEYSSAPSQCLADVTAATIATMRQVAGVAREFDIAVLAAGMLPFTSMAGINWIPKRRVAVMRRYFRGLGEDGCMADGIMGLTTSTQTTLDYTTAEDLAAKVRMATAVAPIAGALFANSPIEDGRLTGVLSRRLQMWRNIAPARSGVLKCAVGRDMAASDLADWVLTHPMIYRSLDGQHVAAPPLPFAEVLAGGFGDGTLATDQDWQSLLDQVWPHVRIRRTIELRIADGPPWPHFGAVAALWTGLTYDQRARTAALDLVRDLTWTELEEATDAVAVSGLQAKMGRDSLGDLARELVRLAGEGLAARVRGGLEPASVLQLLDPVIEIAETGQTFADICGRLWQGDIGQSRAKFVEHYRIA